MESKLKASKSVKCRKSKTNPTSSKENLKPTYVTTTSELKISVPKKVLSSQKASVLVQLASCSTDNKMSEAQEKEFEEKRKTQMDAMINLIQLSRRQAKKYKDYIEQLSDRYKQ